MKEILVLLTVKASKFKFTVPAAGDEWTNLDQRNKSKSKIWGFPIPYSLLSMKEILVLLTLKASKFKFAVPAAGDEWPSPAQSNQSQSTPTSASTGRRTPLFLFFFFSSSSRRLHNFTVHRRLTRERGLLRARESADRRPIKVDEPRNSRDSVASSIISAVNRAPKFV